MPTVSELIHSSFRLIGAIASGETLETNELGDGFVSLNQMRSSWNTEGASLVGRKPMFINFPAAVGQMIMPERPIQIQSATMNIAALNCPLELVDAVGWVAIPEKDMLSVLTKKLFCDYLYPVSTVMIWPKPRLSGALEMWVLAAIAEFTSLDQVLDLPPGYEAGLRYNLAVNLAPEYGRPLDPAVVGLAQQFKASLVQLNSMNHLRSQTQSSMQMAAQDAAEQAVPR